MSDLAGIDNNQAFTVFERFDDCQQLFNLVTIDGCPSASSRRILHVFSIGNSLEIVGEHIWPAASILLSLQKLSRRRFVRRVVFSILFFGRFHPKLIGVVRSLFGFVERFFNGIFSSQDLDSNRTARHPPANDDEDQRQGETNPVTMLDEWLKLIHLRNPRLPVTWTEITEQN